MPSSKFNQRPVPKRRPAICIAPAGSCLPPIDPLMPLNLVGSCGWMDLDPLTPVDLSALITTGNRQTPIAWSGQAILTQGTLSILIQQTDPAGFYDVTLGIDAPPQPPGHYTWPNVFIDPTQPFDTRLLTHVYLPGIDRGFARFAA